MKYFLLSILILLVFQTTHAQYRGDYETNKKFLISVGGEIGAPSNTPYNISYGGYFSAEAKIINRLGFTLAAEYTGYHYKSSLLLGSTEEHPSFTPLKAGLKYYTGPNFYFAGEAGAALSSNDNSMFVYSLGFGFIIPVNKLNDVDVGFAYQNYAQSQYQTTGLKVAYRVGWWSFPVISKR